MEKDAGEVRHNLRPISKDHQYSILYLVHELDTKQA